MTAPSFQVEHRRKFLLWLFLLALVVRVLVGVAVFSFDLQQFFGGDALTYDVCGYCLNETWHGHSFCKYIVDRFIGQTGATGWGMVYLVAGIYEVFGRNMFVTQLFNAVLGAATVPIIFFCAQNIFGNERVARLSALFVAFYPSLVLWSAQGLKDGPIVFLLAAAMLATLKLGERLSPKYLVVLLGALLGVLSMRFYVFYMLLAAVLASLIIGLQTMTAQSLVRQFVIAVVISLALVQSGVLHTTTTQMEVYGNLHQIQLSREQASDSADSGFGRDVDVSTSSGVVTAIPIGLAYLLFAPFPWQVVSLRQSFALPEMVVWWGSFPMLVLGLAYTAKYRMRRALPILLFTTMLTLAYSVFEGNVGNAYRQRSQLLIFYFIFVSVGFGLLKERRESRRQQRTKVESLTTVRKAASPGMARTAFFRAVDEGDLDHVEALVDRGIGIDIRTNDRWTPLMVAAIKGHGRILRRLLESGAEVNAENDRGWTALRYAVSLADVGVTRILLDHGADPNVVDKEGWTALMQAVTEGDLETVELLLAAGAEIHARNKAGETALFLAESTGRSEIAALIERSARIVAHQLIDR
jgi:hypothetical protein